MRIRTFVAAVTSSVILAALTLTPAAAAGAKVTQIKFTAGTRVPVTLDSPEVTQVCSGVRVEHKGQAKESLTCIFPAAGTAVVEGTYVSVYDPALNAGVLTFPWRYFTYGGTRYYESSFFNSYLYPVSAGGPAALSVTMTMTDNGDGTWTRTTEAYYPLNP